MPLPEVVMIKTNRGQPKEQVGVICWKVIRCSSGSACVDRRSSGHGGAGQGSAGQGRPGQGRAGQGRVGQRRAGQRTDELTLS